MIAVLVKPAAPREIYAILTATNDVGSIAPKPIFKMHDVLPKMIDAKILVFAYLLSYL